ncbi:unnamed protein product, partial [Owenia fusiformis]
QQSKKPEFESESSDGSHYEDRFKSMEPSQEFKYQQGVRTQQFEVKGQQRARSQQQEFRGQGRNRDEVDVNEGTYLTNTGMKRDPLPRSSLKQNKQRDQPVQSLAGPYDRRGGYDEVDGTYSQETRLKQQAKTSSHHDSDSDLDEYNYKDQTAERKRQVFRSKGPYKSAQNLHQQRKPYQAYDDIDMVVPTKQNREYITEQYLSQVTSSKPPALRSNGPSRGYQYKHSRTRSAGSGRNGEVLNSSITSRTSGASNGFHGSRTTLNRTSSSYLNLNSSLKGQNTGAGICKPASHFVPSTKNSPIQNVDPNSGPNSLERRDSWFGDQGYEVPSAPSLDEPDSGRFKSGVNITYQQKRSPTQEPEEDWFAGHGSVRNLASNFQNHAKTHTFQQTVLRNRSSIRCMPHLQEADNLPPKTFAVVPNAPQYRQLNNDESQQSSISPADSMPDNIKPSVRAKDAQFSSTPQHQSRLPMLDKTKHPMEQLKLDPVDSLDEIVTQNMSVKPKGELGKGVDNVDSHMVKSPNKFESNNDTFRTALESSNSNNSSSGENVDRINRLLSQADKQIAGMNIGNGKHAVDDDSYFDDELNPNAEQARHMRLQQTMALDPDSNMTPERDLEGRNFEPKASNYESRNVTFDPKNMTYDPSQAESTIRYIDGTAGESLFQVSALGNTNEYMTPFTPYTPGNRPAMRNNLQQMTHVTPQSDQTYCEQSVKQVEVLGESGYSTELKVASSSTNGGQHDILHTRTDLENGKTEIIYEETVHAPVVKTKMIVEQPSSSETESE